MPQLLLHRLRSQSSEIAGCSSHLMVSEPNRAEPCPGAMSSSLEHRPAAISERREIELRIFLRDPSTFMRWLRCNATWEATEYQVDHYYEVSERAFVVIGADGSKDADEWLRVRLADSHDSICYKKWRRDPSTGRSLWAEEIEVNVASGQAVRELFERLGLREIALVAKKRDKWSYGSFIVDCDQVEGLGSFFEIEHKGHLEDPSRGRELIEHFLHETGLEEWRVAKRGYPWQLWNPSLDPFEPLAR